MVSRKLHTNTALARVRHFMSSHLFSVFGAQAFAIRARSWKERSTRLTFIRKAHLACTSFTTIAAFLENQKTSFCGAKLWPFFTIRTTTILPFAL